MLARGTQGKTAVCLPAPLNLNQNGFIFHLPLFLELNKKDGLDFSHVIQEASLPLSRFLQPDFISINTSVHSQSAN